MGTGTPSIVGGDDQMGEGVHGAPSRSNSTAARAVLDFSSGLSVRLKSV